MKLRLLLLVLLIPFVSIAQAPPIQKKVEITGYSCSNLVTQVEVPSLSKNSHTAKDAIDAVTFLLNTDKEQAYSFLWDYNQSGQTTIYSIQNSINAVNYFKENVIRTLYSDLQNETIINFVNYFRAFDYFAWYKTEVIKVQQYDDILISAIPTLYQKPEYWANNPKMDAFRWDATLLMDIEYRRGELWPSIKYHLQNGIGNGLNAASAVIWRGLINGDSSLISKIFQDSTYINDIYKLCMNSDVRISTNFINTLGLILLQYERMPDNIKNTFNINQYITMLNTLERNLQVGSSQHLKLISSLYEYNGKYAFSVNYDDIKNQYYNQQFSKEIPFEDGSLIIHSSLSDDVINELYLSLREAKSNFFKLSKDVNPIDGDINDVIHIYIFESSETYNMLGGMFFGIPTNNGGIYIENHSSLYTFNRQDELLPLDMLLKHEYAHYLDGRYNIHGTFGELEFYDWIAGRYVWWTEGLANYVASAEPKTGFYISAFSGNLISNDNGNYLSLETSLRNSYNYGGRMYAYSEAAWGYLNTIMPDAVNQMFKLVRTNSTQEFWNLLDSIAFNKDLQTGYTTYLNNVAADWKQNKISDPGLREYTFTSTEVTPDQLKEVIDIVNIVQEYSLTSSYSQPYKFVKLSKSITYTDDLATSIQKIDQYLENTILQFHQASSEFTGFSIVTAWIESISEDSTGITFNVSFEIPLNGSFEEVVDPVDPIDPVDPTPEPEPEILNMVLYPNPSVDVINVTNVKAGAQVTIFNLRGQIVYQQNLVADGFVHSVSQLPTGIYIVNIIQSGRKTSIKFIKR